MTTYERITLDCWGDHELIDVDRTDMAGVGFASVIGASVGSIGTATGLIVFGLTFDQAHIVGTLAALAFALGAYLRNRTDED
jgi:hypothetical protein